MKRILVLIVAISAIAVFAGHVYGQQNTAATPYRDSEHAYRVKIGAGSHREWKIVIGATTHNLTADDATIDWAEIVPTGAGAGQAGAGFYGVKIFFDHTIFTSSITTCELQYFEYLDQGGGLQCISARKFDISLNDNTFRFLVSTDEVDRNSTAAYPGKDVYNVRNNQTNTWDELKDADDLFATTLTYTVTMNKDDQFDPSYWQFDAIFSEAQAVASFNAQLADATQGTLALTQNTAGRDYTLRFVPNTDNPSSVKITITVTYAHIVLDDTPHQLDLQNGFAVTSETGAPDAITQDNITTYPLGAEGNRTQALTILAIPSTRDITFDDSATANTNETDASSKNPLQNSTHYYEVEMGAIDNTGSWSLVTSTGDPVDWFAAGTGSGITATKNTSHALATINYGTLPVGTYTLYFSETDAARETITRRSYPISIQPPFEIVLADRGNDCADVSGELKTALEATTTDVTYTIRLKDNDPGADESYYAQAWSFLFTVSGFNADLEVNSMTSSDASLSGTGTSRTVAVAAGTYSVNVTVTYLSLYSSEHVITATASNATGVFNEKAADESDTHTIYAMPQAGTLAGVD